MRNTFDLFYGYYYTERFIAEYLLTKIRFERLKNLISKIEAGETFNHNQEAKNLLDFIDPITDINFLKEKVDAMKKVLYFFEIREYVEEVDLEKIKIDYISD